jgi:hypothetical protein
MTQSKPRRLYATRQNLYPNAEGMWRKNRPAKGPQILRHSISTPLRGVDMAERRIGFLAPLRHLQKKACGGMAEAQPFPCSLAHWL